MFVHRWKGNRRAAALKRGETRKAGEIIEPKPKGIVAQEFNAEVCFNGRNGRLAFENRPAFN